MMPRLGWVCDRCGWYRVVVFLLFVPAFGHYVTVVECPHCDRYRAEDDE